MTRLCIVTQSHSRPAIGGAEQQIECLLDSLVETRRHDIYFLAHLIGNDTGSNGYRVVRIGQGRQVARFGYWVDAIPLYRSFARDTAGRDLSACRLRIYRHCRVLCTEKQGSHDLARR